MKKIYLVYRIDEIILAFLSFLWAVWIIFFGTYKNSSAFTPMRELGVPIWIPLVWTVILGAAILIAPKRYRPDAHLLMCFFWVFIAVSLIYVNSSATSTGIPTYFIVAMLHATRYIFAKWSS